MRKYRIVLIAAAVIMLSLFWLNSTIWFRFKLARFYEQRGYGEKVISVQEKILRKSEMQAKRLFSFFGGRLSAEDEFVLSKRLGDYYLNSGNKDKAIKYYQVLRRLYPEKVSECLNLYMLNQDTDKLVDIILDTQDKNLEGKLPQRYLESALWQYSYGLGLMKREKFQEARDVFTRLASEYPYLFTFHRCLEYIYRNLGMNGQADQERQIVDYLNPGYLKLSGGSLSLDSEPSFDFIGIWNFNEGKGKIVKDASGRFNDGRIVDAQWVKGISGCGLEFDGIDDKVIIPDNKDTHLYGKDFTITMWIKPVPQKKHRFVYNKGCPYLSLNNRDDTWVFQIKDTYGRKPARVSHPIRNKWYFVVQRVAQDREHKVWVFDGRELIVSKEKKVDKIVDAGIGDFYLGRRGWFTKDNANYEGKIDEVIIFDRALTDNEINRLYESRRTVLN